MMKANSISACLAVAMLAAGSLYGQVAAGRPVVKTGPDRNATALQVSLKKIGCLRPKSVREVGPSNFTIDGAPVDRDFVDFDKYCHYLEPLGVNKIRILTGWVYEIPQENQISHAGGITFVRIPAYDSPCFVTERALLDLR